MSGLLVPEFVIPREGALFLNRLADHERDRERFSKLARAQRDRLGLDDDVRFAEIFPDEGLDYILNTFPRATQAVPTTLYLGLFTSQTASTVPADTSVLATPTGVTEETSSSGYARASILNTSWPAPADSGTGRRSTVVAPGISFAESTGAFGATINGFFCATASSAGVALFYANFSDTTAVTVNSAGYTVRVAPFWHIDA